MPGVLEPEPPITVRMLLDHSSGIFNVGDEGDIVADIDKLTDPAMRAEATELGARYLSRRASDHEGRVVHRSRRHP